MDHNFKVQDTTLAKVQCSDNWQACSVWCVPSTTDWNRPGWQKKRTTSNVCTSLGIHEYECIHISMKVIKIIAVHGQRVSE